MNIVSLLRNQLICNESDRDKISIEYPVHLLNISNHLILPFQPQSLNHSSKLSTVRILFLLNHKIVNVLVLQFHLLELFFKLGCSFLFLSHNSFYLCNFVMHLARILIVLLQRRLFKINNLTIQTVNPRRQLLQIARFPRILCLTLIQQIYRTRFHLQFLSNRAHQLLLNAFYFLILVVLLLYHAQTTYALLVSVYNKTNKVIVLPLLCFFYLQHPILPNRYHNLTQILPRLANHIQLRKGDHPMRSQHHYRKQTFIVHRQGQQLQNTRIEYVKSLLILSPANQYVR